MKAYSLFHSKGLFTNPDKNYAALFRAAQFLGNEFSVYFCC